MVYPVFFFVLTNFPTTLFFYILIITVTHTHITHTQTQLFTSSSSGYWLLFFLVYTHSSMFRYVYSASVYYYYPKFSVSGKLYTSVGFLQPCISVKANKKIQFFGQNTFAFLFILS